MLKNIFSKNKSKISRTSPIAETNLSIERMKDADVLERRRLVVQRELEERINGISRHLCELDRDISKLAEEVRGEYINAKKG